MKRHPLVLLGGSVAAVSALAALLGAFLLAAWVPTAGKARLEAELERHLPLDVSIRSARYVFLRGILLTEVTVAHRVSGEVWFHAKRLRLRVGWPTALLVGRVPFAVSGPMQIPYRADFVMAGSFDRRTKALRLQGRSAEASWRTLTTPLTHLLPPSLADGRFRVRAHMNWQPPEPLRLAGRLSVERLVWTDGRARLTADLDLEGEVTPSPLAVQALALLRRGTLEGVPRVGPLTDLEGSARVAADRVEIERLAATGLGSRWTLEGTVAPLTPPSLEALLTTRAELAGLTSAFAGADWQASGPADVQLVCRGPLQPALWLDCLADADVRDATLQTPHVAPPVTRINGRLRYDLLARQVTTPALTARILEEPLTVRGSAQWTGVPRCDVTVEGRLALAAMASRLPVREPGGVATVDLAIEGPFSALRYTGRADLEAARGLFGDPPHRLEQLAGPILLRGNALDARDLTLRLDDIPVTVSATVALEAAPRFETLVRFPTGQLSGRGRLGTDAVTIEEALLALPATRMRVAGTVARTRDRAHRLTARGRLALQEWGDVPLVPWPPALKAWSPAGLVDVEGDFEGRFEQWRGASLRLRGSSDALQIRGWPLEQVQADVEQRGGTLRARLPAARVAGGQTHAELTIEHRPSESPFAAELDVAGLQLERLAQTIPAWRDRPIRGTASAHALLTGGWGVPATWRGSGWLNASGEHLGEIPLLQKVFRGIFGLLGERLGLESLRRAQVTQASLTWRLAAERVATDDVRLGGLAGQDPVAVYARGSVGLDQTLDFVIEPELAEGTVLQAPATATLAGTILKAAGQFERFRRLVGRHRLTGTLKEPKYRFEYSMQETATQLVPAAGDALQGILDLLGGR